jgi:AraC-like DNA-binding protein
MYGERASRLSGAVVWAGIAGAGVQRVLPDGCMDLIWSERGLLVAGPDTRAFLTTGPPGAQYVGLRFAPGAGPAVLGVPAHALRDERVPLDAIWPGAEANRLAQRVADAADKGAVLEDIALRKTGTVALGLPTAVAHGLAAGRTVTAVAELVGLGERQLHRRCLDAFGYGPKTLARVLRMQRALRLARRGIPFAEVAAVAGYADQPHLAREIKALAGVPLGELVR